MGILTLVLAGCPFSPDRPTVLVTDNLNLPTEQRPGSGATLPGDDPGGSGGGNPTPEPATTVLLTSPLRVDSLPESDATANLAISNAPKGMLALAVPGTAPRELGLGWSGQSGLQPLRSARSTLAASVQDQASKKRELRLRAARSTFRPSTELRVQAGRTLSEGMILQLKVDSTIPNVAVKVVHVDPGVQVGSVRRQKFAILVDTRDEELLFADSQGRQLLDKLAKRLHDSQFGDTGTYKTMRDLFGDDPTIAEAKAKGVTFDQEDTLFVFSRAINKDSDITAPDGETQTLGYFYQGDFADDQDDGFSNQAKALYLASSAAYQARSDASTLDDLSATIAHELEHMLFAWSRVKAVGMAARGAENTSRADAWIDEGLAMYAMVANGYGLEKADGAPNPSASFNLAAHVQTFLDLAPRFSLTAFYADKGNPDDAYGMAYLFAQYLVDQQGTDIIPKILSSTKNGLTAGKPVTPEAISPTGIVADALAKDQTTLETVFGNFAGAIALDGSSALAGTTNPDHQALFDIQRINLRHAPFGGLSFTGPAGTTAAPFVIKPFGVNFVKPASLSPSSSLKLSGKAGISVKLILHQ